MYIITADPGWQKLVLTSWIVITDSDGYVMMFSLEKEIWSTRAALFFEEMELCSYISCCAVSLKAPTSCCPRDLCTVAVSQKRVFRSPALICMGRTPPRKLREAGGWDKSTSWPHTHDGFPAYMNADCWALLRDLSETWTTNSIDRETQAHFQCRTKAEAS